MIRKTQNGKKVLALACAAALSVSGIALPVQAAETTVSSSGEMNYVDMTAYTKVLLPTSSTMSFALDPQGLSTMSDATADAKDLSAAAGNIVSNGEVSVVNYGYYPIKVTTKFFVTDTGKSTLVENESEVDADTTRKVYLTVTPSQSKTTVTTEDTTDAKGNTITNIATTEGYTASSESVAINGATAATAKGMVFALQGAEYEFTKTTDDTTGKDTYAAALKSGGDAGVASFKIGGKINKNADWAAYIAAKAPKTIKLNAVFSYETMTDDEYAYITDSANNLIQAGTYNMIENRRPDMTGLNELSDIKLDASKGGSVMINLGSGIDAAKVKNVTVVRHVIKTKKADSAVVNVPASRTVIAGATANSTGTILNIPALPAGIQNEIAKVDTEDTELFDAATSEYKKLYYEDANFTYEPTFGLVIALTDGTASEEIPLTFIKYQGPTVTFTGAAQAKSATAKANTGMQANMFTITFGNGGANTITKVVLNKSKTTATVTDVNDTMVDFATGAGKTMSIKAGAFKYTSGAEATKVVYTVTFDTGETTDFEIPIL